MKFKELKKGRIIYYEGMKYGIQSMDSGCDYTELSTLEECKEWVLLHLYELERDNARYIQIVNAGNHDEIIFYENVEWVEGESNLKQIAEKINFNAITGGNI